MDAVGSIGLPVVLGVSVLSQVFLWVIVYQLVRQRGRLLMRLDRLEHQIPKNGHGSLNGHMADHPGQLPILAHGPRPQQPAGLAVGTPLDRFRLPELGGKYVSLQDFVGKRVLLVHWSPQCGFCDLIAPELAKLEPELQKANVQLVLVSYGEAENNHRLAEEHGLRCPILLQSESDPVKAFNSLGTPAAYLLDEQGRVASPLAVGADRVPVLAREAAAGSGWTRRLRGVRPLSESRIEREGLKAGILAPSFTLPDLRGNTVSLADYRGRRVLLVFTDPHCGPCDELAPRLARLPQDDSLALIVVGRGDVEENRRKVEQHGWEFPMVLQKQWELSKAFGIFATPVGFLIGEDGKILRNVATGVDAILALAHLELPAGKR